MKIFKDVISGDELLSDAYEVKLIDGAVYEADCAMVNVSGGGDVDIGGNPSAEDAAEDLEDGVETVNNVVYSFRLQQTQFDKKSFLTYVKGYMKKVKAYLAEHNPDEIEAFEKGATKYVKKVIANFGDWDFYTGESMDPDGMVVLLNYREDGTTPFVAIWKHGVNEEKI
ncbi:translationally-controlled tumor protein homolog [[Candida] railenensis]|uniref:Translationally-controlled tumor protein homolog n=1 Tax=[Candida] railenensis TaxID=45579 RepID=A0A9P0VYB5_9ASCO|nr:translationally-controlled tumor protein homolog [[Candida] railenensis]